MSIVYVFRDGEKFGIQQGFVALGLDNPPPTLEWEYIGDAA